MREGCILAYLLSCAHGCLLCVFTWFCLGACVCVLIASSFGVRLILVTSFYLNYPLKCPITKSNHSLKPWGVRSSTYEFGGDTIQPIAKLIFFFNLVKSATLFECILYNPAMSLIKMLHPCFSIIGKS